MVYNRNRMSECARTNIAYYSAMRCKTLLDALAGPCEKTFAYYLNSEIKLHLKY